MKIIVANYRYFIAGGPEKYMFKFIEAAEKRGVEIIPFSVDHPQNKETPYKRYFAKPRADELMYADTKRTVKNMVGMYRAVVWNWDAEKRLRRLIQDTRPDAVYILHEINHLSPSIIRAAKREGVRVVHRVSDFFMLCPRYDLLCGDEICEACIQGDHRKAIKSRCVKGSLAGTMLRIHAMKLYKRKKIFEKVDKFICTCSFSRKKLIEGGVPAEKVDHVPTFIDTSKIKPCYENGRYFLFLGRLAHQKGPIYAIKAMKWLKDTGYVLKMTGKISDSAEDQKLWKYIVENKLEEKIIFTGFLGGEALEELISKATCIVCPAIWYENMPNTVIEAYAHGKPVVASRVGSLAEIIDDNETGMLFAMKDPEELAQKLRLFVEDEGLCRKMGKRARAKCEREYGVEEHMDRILQELGG